VAGLPLGSTEVVRPTVMVNIIGQHPKSEDVLALEGAHLHLYNKSEREGRKIGHITLMPNDSAQLSSLCRRLAKILPNPLALCEDMTI
jgi:5-(carboxyamino)imidazole ribonucleotide synthase